MAAWVALYARRPDGGCWADHARAVWEATGRWPSGVPEPPDIPWELEHVWEDYRELRGAAGEPVPLRWEALEAWSRLRGVAVDGLRGWLLRELDAAYLEAMAAVSQKSPGK